MRKKCVVIGRRWKRLFWCVIFSKKIRAHNMRCYRWNGNNVFFTVSFLVKMKTLFVSSHWCKDSIAFSEFSSFKKIKTWIMMCHRSQKDQNPKNTLSSLTDDNAFSVYASAVDTCRYNVDFTQNHICRDIAFINEVLSLDTTEIIPSFLLLHL